MIKKGYKVIDDKYHITPYGEKEEHWIYEKVTKDEKYIYITVKCAECGYIIKTEKRKRLSKIEVRTAKRRIEEIERKIHELSKRESVLRRRSIKIEEAISRLRRNVLYFEGPNKKEYRFFINNFFSPEKVEEYRPNPKLDRTYIDIGGDKLRFSPGYDIREIPLEEALKIVGHDTYKTNVQVIFFERMKRRFVTRTDAIKYYNRLLDNIEKRLGEVKRKKKMLYKEKGKIEKKIIYEMED